MTAQEVIKSFMAKLANYGFANSDTIGTDMLDLAVKGSSRYSGIQDAIDAMTTDQIAAEKVAVAEVLGSDYADKLISDVEISRVKFRELNQAQIKAYISSGECDDKAGAYAVQGLGSLLIEYIKGDYYNVVGLPLCKFGKMLSNFNITLENLLNA